MIKVMMSRKNLKKKAVAMELIMRMTEELYMRKMTEKKVTEKQKLVHGRDH